MALDLIVEEAKGMSDEALMEVLHYMQFIKIVNDNRFPSAPHTNEKKRRGGFYKGAIHITEDFDKPLSDFREYM